jgi:hypothetical protein
VNNLRQHRRENDARPNLRPAGAEAACSLDQALIDRVDRRDRRDGQDEIDAHEHDEDRGRIADPEQHDAERDPSNRRDRRQSPYERHDHIGEGPGRRNQDSGGDGGGESQSKAGQDP